MTWQDVAVGIALAVVSVILMVTLLSLVPISWWEVIDNW